MAELLIYRASAGSGKTHILVTRYIQWALCYPTAFKHILAVTFTNRATQEMKERILSHLYHLSIGQATVLQEMLCQTGWTPAKLQLRSKEVLSTMIYQYGDCSVTTIDSFFHKILQSFAQSLGLPHHFSIEMDEPLALKETIDELSTEPSLQPWIVDFALTKLLAGKSWNIKSHLQELGKTLFDESFKLHEKALLTDFKEAWPNLVSAIQASVHSFEQRMQKIGQTALHLMQQEGLTPSDFTYGSKGVIGYFLKLASKKEVTPTKRAIIGHNDLTSWYKKTNKTTPIAQVVERLLHPLLGQAITLYEKEGLAYRTAIVGSRFTYAFGMIGALLIGLERYRDKNNVLFMSDIAALLHQTIQGRDIPYLYKKIGNQFHHFLIDEFQDLSCFQWMNIKPLLRNSLAQGYASLLVGDVKQSIYRWRGSNWKLLNHQVETEFQESTIHGLTINRRSQESIILFNNHFFKRAAGQLVNYLESILPAMDPLPYELAQMRRAYDDVAQQTNPKKGGYVELFLLHSDPEAHPTAWKTHAQKAFINLLEELKQKGIPAKDIVVLIRNNREATLLTHLCHPTTSPYKVVSDHAHSLGQHIAIKVLIHALYYLNNENDLINSVAWIEAYSSCMGNESYRGQHDRYYQVVKGDIQKLLHPSFWAQKDFLKHISVYTCIHLLIEALFKVPHGFSDLFVFFQSIVLNFSLTESDSIESFLVWWEKRGRMIKLPISHNNDVIRTMTIHQSKGLAFKVVIMPFCNWGLDHQNGPILWSLNHQQGPFPIWPIGYGTDLKETHYAQDYYLEQMQIHLDNLNLLYVAFTRAEAQLYVIAPLPDKMESIATISDLIYQALAAEKTDPPFEGKFPLATKVQATDLGTKFCFG